ncbi:hypothetical protein ACFE04_009983 [Oxalis oulophora]
MDVLQISYSKLLLGFIITTLLAIIVATYFFYTKRSSTKGCLDPNVFKEFKLIKKTQLSHNSAKFRFALPTPTSVFGLPPGQHVFCRGRDYDGRDVVRPYTPITLDSDLGYFELVVKMYPKGKMSHYLREIVEGDTLAVKGPKGRFKHKASLYRAYGMIAGGSGITPMFQLIRAILENHKDTTKLHLIYGNTTEEDILLKDELDGYASNFPNRFKIYYVLSQPPETWNGGVGRISKEMIQSYLPAPASDIQILRCGPLGMTKTMAAHLDAIGYSSDMQFQMFKPFDELFVDTVDFNDDALMIFFEKAGTPIVTMCDEADQTKYPFMATFQHSRHIDRAMLFTNLRGEDFAVFQSKYREVAEKYNGNGIRFMLGDLDGEASRGAYLVSIYIFIFHFYW